VIEGQQAVQAFVPFTIGRSVANLGPLVRQRDHIIDPLVIPFRMVVGKILPKDVAKLVLARQRESVGRGHSRSRA
jgi:hypothetical protein